MSLSASLNLGMCASLRTDNERISLQHNSGFFVEDDNPGPVVVESRGPIFPGEKDVLSRWVIQTKWETPVLDFTNVTSSALDLSTSTVVSVTGSPWRERYWNSYYTQSFTPSTRRYLTSSRGIWHQKGHAIPDFGTTSQKGYHLEVEDIITTPDKPGLATILGFIGPKEEPIIENLPLVNEHLSLIHI